LSHTMLRACCWVCAVRCSPHTKYGSAACCLLHLACARILLHVVCYLLHGVCCMLPVARCRLFAVCCAMSAGCCVPHAARCLLPCCVLSVARRLLSSPRCLLHAGTLPVAGCLLHGICCVACRLLFAVGCMKSGACCMLPVARCMSFAALLPAAWRMVSGRCVLHAAWRRLHLRRVVHAVCCLLHWSLARCPIACRRCTLSIACRTFSVARPTVPCRMGCAACRLFRLVSRPLHAACCDSSLARCIFHVRMSHGFSHPLPVPSFMLHVVQLQSDTAPSHTQRIAPALAIEVSAAGEAKR
jgi:hypothetical protein